MLSAKKPLVDGEQSIIGLVSAWLRWEGYKYEGNDL